VIRKLEVRKSTPAREIGSHVERLPVSARRQT
jgi:hypothetical protein